MSGGERARRAAPEPLPWARDEDAVGSPGHTILSARTHRARAHHSCSDCTEIIRAGTPYTGVVYLDSYRRWRWAKLGRGHDCTCAFDFERRA